MNIAHMVESAASTSINTQDKANTANAQAYLSPANNQAERIIQGASLLIEPSESGIPEPPSGGAAVATKTPGGASNIGVTGAGGASGGATRSEETGRSETSKSGEIKGNKGVSNKGERSTNHTEHTDNKELNQGFLSNQSEKRV
jgi:hypothetical protein